MSSPAERYAAARRRAAQASAFPALDEFSLDLGFDLDDFQREACEALERGSGVLVCAPTGAGKTVVGEFAVHLALRGRPGGDAPAARRKCFYTTPIKALSNQKYHDLVDRYGAEQVGLLTGDNAINGDAPVVVMTTEVLRNMLYAGSATLRGPGVRGDGRGPLPGRPVPRRGLGRGDHPPARVGHAGVAVGHRLQRRGVRRLAGHRTRRDRRGGLRAPPGAAVAAHARRQADVRPVPRRRRRPQARRAPGAAALHPGHDAPAGAGRGPQRRPRRRPARPALARPDAPGHRRPARPGGAAAGDPVHLQPGRLRRRRAAVPRRRAAADLPGGTRRDPPGGRVPGHRHPRRGPVRARLLGVARRAGARAGRAPRRHAPRVQGGRRGAVRPRAGQGRLRHRDARAGHQHAGPLRGAGTPGQVQRRGPRRPHPGRVHPAHRPGRPPGHRRRGPRGRGLVAGDRPPARGRARLHPHLPAALQLPAVVQHGRQPGRQRRRGAGPGAAGVLVRAVPGRPVGGRPGPAGAAQHRDHRGVRRGGRLPPRRLRRVLRAAGGDRRPGTGHRPAGADPAQGGGRRLAGAAAGRRRDPGAVRAAGRPGGGAGPGHRRVRRAPAAGAHPGPLGRAGHPG